MALTKRQKLVASEMALYWVVSKLDEGEFEDYDEAEVVEEMISNVSARTRKYEVMPDGNITEIVAYVKANY